jgi:hypothetical protein
MFFTSTVTRRRSQIKLLCASPLVAVTTAGAIRGQSEPKKADRATPAGFSFLEPVQPPRQVQVMVHRGLAVAAPENSQRAIAACIAEEFEWLDHSSHRQGQRAWGGLH